MTLYRNIDNQINCACEDCLRGEISIGSFQSNLLNSIAAIVSLEDKEVRNRLYDLEAHLDGELALYYGADGIDDLDNKFVNDNYELKELLEPIIREIQNVIELS